MGVRKGKTGRVVRLAREPVGLEWSRHVGTSNGIYKMMVTQHRYFHNGYLYCRIAILVDSPYAIAIFGPESKEWHASKTWGVDCQDDIDHCRGRSSEINDMDNGGTGMKDVRGRSECNSRDILLKAERSVLGWIWKSLLFLSHIGVTGYFF